MQQKVEKKTILEKAVTTFDFVNLTLQKYKKKQIKEG